MTLMSHGARREAPSATVSFALRMVDGRYLASPDYGALGTFDLALAHLWLWPLIESDEARAARIAEVRKRMPWSGPLSAVRAKP